MFTSLQNKTAIITGASHGVGMEIGRKFLLAGANVVFSDYAKFDLESLISGISCLLWKNPLHTATYFDL